VASASSDGTVRLWNMATCTVERDLPTVRGRVNAVDFSPAGNVVAAACGDGSVRFYRVDNGTELDRLAVHTGPAYAVAFSPDGQRIATAGAEPRGAEGERGEVRIQPWMQTARLGEGDIVRLPHPARAHGAAWSPDGRRLVTACADGLVREWDALVGSLRGAFEGHADDVNWVAWSRDGSRVASASSDGTVRLWKPAERWSSVALTGPVGQVWEVAFSPDGSRVAGVGADGSLHLWHAESGRHLVALDRHNGSLWQHDSPLRQHDSPLRHHDSPLRHHDSPLRQHDSPLRQHDSPLWGVAFSPDGRRILTGSDDGTVRVWGMSPAELHRERLGHQR